MSSTGHAPVFVKVCGLTRAEDLSACFDGGIDFTGLIFAPKSPRRISPEQAAGLPCDPSGRCKRVGVFMKQPLEEILRISEAARLDLIQLHGGEDPEYCRAVGPERVIKTLWPQKLSPVDPVEPVDPVKLEAEFARFAPVCSYFLLDSGLSGGGSGQRLDEKALSMLAAVNPPRPWFLAGGLDGQGAVQALRYCRPYALDFNSGLEVSPGIKDAQKIKLLKQMLKYR